MAMLLTGDKSADCALARTSVRLCGARVGMGTSSASRWKAYRETKQAATRYKTQPSSRVAIRD